ncbi:related to pH-response regulator protein palH/RIM21 [Rhynchosporium secalis]|uniref:Related to pH-response regulator protein palH/RIM21 n=1 Tax=Rhynchosporium secalis TaxID=38038 RepID=A0A1E1LV98_RHYSE|nr:related to pH-response regulator protein palH/RIM21 [Rhynchosporium secalis]
MEMEVRQIINIARPSRTSTATSTPHCTPFTLPSNGVLKLAVDNIITLTSDAVFQPECTGNSGTVLVGEGSPNWTDFRDPFYASTIPECYALAAATVIAYMLVIMLFITPRTFLREGAVVLGRRGFTNGPSASDAGIGIGGRPWLQKVAALTVAISLTIATADTFRVAEAQYHVGYMDAAALQSEVEDGLELKIIRVISDTFLWLAQAQTLIRLFPRQREKVIIKWTAFALISLDVLFSILNNFVYNGNSRPRSFVDAIPALAYLFQLALSLLYAAWVLYYAITKKQFAFYHAQMKNMCLVSLLSLVSVLIPVVFFVLDISQPSLAGWGDYVRWVGAAAASVVVWEWVERIEALERDDKKDGILGREVFDGDEMLDANSSSHDHRKRNNGNDDDGDRDGGGGAITSSNGRSWPSVAGLAHRYRPRAKQDVETGRSRANGTTRNRKGPRPRPPLWPTRPPPTATPISRTDSASAESTVYAIRYHPISESTPSARENTRESVPPTELSRHNSAELVRAPSIRRDSGDDLEKKSIIERMEDGYGTEPPPPPKTNAWDAFAKVNPFRKRGKEPPPQVSAHTAKTQETANAHSLNGVWDVRARIEDFAVTQAERLREKNRGNAAIGPMPVTVIPAPPRRRDLAVTLEEIEEAERREQQPRTQQQQPAERPILERSISVATRTTAPTDEGESSRQSQQQRSSDPYRPDNLNGHAIHQRGAISFVTAIPQDRDATEHPHSSSSHNETQRVTPLSLIASTRSSPNLPRSPSSLRRSDGMPVTSIPAPPRRPRSTDEDD